VRVRGASECVVDAAALLGECPLWSPTEQVLYWIDIDARLIHRYDPAAGTDEARAVAGRPGSIALSAERGRLLLASEHQVAWFDWADSSFSPFIDLEAAGTGNRMNDGRCDPAGRFWVGSMYELTDAGRFEGRLHRLDPDGTHTRHREQVGVPNALAFSPSGDAMYWADTMHDKIWAYDYDPASGERSNERVFVDFEQLPGRPDGACVDETGALWVACVYGWSVARFDPAGKLDRLVELPVARPTMPAFGGAKYETMYVTSIGDGGTHGPIAGQTCPGGLFAVEVGVGGLPETPFGSAQ